MFAANEIVSQVGGAAEAPCGVGEVGPGPSTSDDEGCSVGSQASARAGDQIQNSFQGSERSDGAGVLPDPVRASTHDSLGFTVHRSRKNTTASLVSLVPIVGTPVCHTKQQPLKRQSVEQNIFRIRFYSEL